MRDKQLAAIWTMIIKDKGIAKPLRKWAEKEKHLVIRRSS